MVNNKRIQNIWREFWKNDLINPDETWPFQVVNALSYLNDELINSQCTVERVKDLCAIRDHNFASLFKHYTGYTPASYLKKHRVEFAKRVMVECNNNRTISQIAHYCGYRRPNSFSTAFKDLTGYSPKRYWSIQQKKPKGKTINKPMK